MDMKLFAERPQAFIRKHFEREVPVLDQRARGPEAFAEPAIVLTRYGGGDMYSGATNTEEVRFALPRPDSGKSFSIYFAVTMHELSGQCDQWSLSLTGARPDEVAALRTIFFPAQYSGWWNNHVGPELVIDGVRQSFEAV